MLNHKWGLEWGLQGHNAHKVVHLNSEQIVIYEDFYVIYFDYRNLNNKEWIQAKAFLLRTVNANKCSAAVEFIPLVTWHCNIVLPGCCPQSVTSGSTYWSVSPSGPSPEKSTTNYYL